MKAIVLRVFGGPEALRFEEIAVPEHVPDKALIRVHYVLVNFTLDVMVRKVLLDPIQSSNQAVAT